MDAIQGAKQGTNVPIGISDSPIAVILVSEELPVLRVTGK